jgi:hypothetical protein
VVAAGVPGVFAAVTAIGPVARNTSSATGCSGMRTATVPSVSPRSHCNVGDCSTMIVSAPGQNASTRSRAAGGMRVTRPSSVCREPTKTGGGT